MSLTSRPIVISTPIDTRGHAVRRTYVEWAQSVPATIWVVPHNFGRLPVLNIVDSDGNVVSMGASVGIKTTVADVHLDDTNATITFTEPTTGKVILT